MFKTGGFRFLPRSGETDTFHGSGTIELDTRKHDTFPMTAGWT